MTIKEEPYQEGSFLYQLKCMPDIVQLQLKNVAMVAYEGVIDQRIVFYNLSSDFEHMNFMNKRERLVRFGRYKKSCCFSHFLVATGGTISLASQASFRATIFSHLAVSCWPNFF